MDEKTRRKVENKRILAKMMRGESLATVPADATWFPPRPLVTKDPDALSRLYGVSQKKKSKLTIVGTEYNDT
jgi:hypothetical protein